VLIKYTSDALHDGKQTTNSLTVSFVDQTLHEHMAQW